MFVVVCILCMSNRITKISPQMLLFRRRYFSTAKTSAPVKTLYDFVNRRRVLSVYRQAFRCAREVKAEAQRREIEVEIRSRFETFRNVPELDAKAVSHLLSDVRVRLRELREIVDMSR